MPSATVTSKGQITIPKEIRDELALARGDEIEFIRRDGAIQIEKRIAGDPFEEYRGYFKDLEGQDVDELIEDWRGR